jgi:cell division protein FtsN
MAKDYVRKSGSKRSGAKATRRQPTPSHPGRWFGAGLACGVFLSFITWLAMQPGTQPPTLPAQTGSEEAPPQPRFDFYTLLPEQQVRVELEPEELASARSQATDNDQYLLQAGSFKQAADADRRRAELLLLGLDARVEEAVGDNGRWFRVYVGPFETRSKMARARGLTAQQGIDTLLMKRPGGGRG